ncbi:MAG: hypothetical protein KAW09_08095, partial [Thermoplasmata archaeon]|nr:hypothetical protein [Thermoplasmata archaeon]
MAGEVERILPENPVEIYAGQLTMEVGREEFLPLSYHQDIMEKMKRESTHRASIWLLAGPVGSGKTWTLAWLGRDVRDQERAKPRDKWAVGVVPGISAGTDPSRAMVESFFRSTERFRSHFLAEIPSTFQMAIPKSGDRIPRILRQALRNDELWGVLTGYGSQFGTIKGIGKGPKW